MADLLPLTTSPPTLRTALIPGTVCSSNQTQLMNSLNTLSGSALLSQRQRLRSYRWEHSSSWLPLKDHVVSRVLIGWVLNLFSRKKNLRPFPSFFLIFSSSVKLGWNCFVRFWMVCGPPLEQGKPKSVRRRGDTVLQSTSRTKKISSSMHWTSLTRKDQSLTLNHKVFPIVNRCAKKKLKKSCWNESSHSQRSIHCAMWQHSMHHPFH